MVKGFEMSIQSYIWTVRPIIKKSWERSEAKSPNGNKNSSCASFYCVFQGLPSCWRLSHKVCTHIFFPYNYHRATITPPERNSPIKLLNVSFEENSCVSKMTNNLGTGIMSRRWRTLALKTYKIATRNWLPGQTITICWLYTAFEGNWRRDQTPKKENRASSRGYAFSGGRNT